MIRLNSRRRLTALVSIVGVIAAACTSGGDDVTTQSADSTAPSTAEDESSDDSPDGDGDGGSGGSASSGDDTSADGGADSSGGPLRAPTVAPDVEGLPLLTEADADTRTGTLDNGLRYFVRSNDNPGSKADLRLTIDAGSALEDEDQLGGAHFLEHMLFNGTERFPKNELVDTLRSFGAAFGADVNAYTSFDETVYSLNVPADDETVELGLDVLEQWLSFALIDPDEVAAERGIVLDEWRVRDQTANGRIFNEISSFFLDGTAYENRLPIGGEQAILATDADALRRYYERWYRPDNAAVIVVGDIDVDEIEAAIIERFGEAENPETPLDRPNLVVDPADETRALVVDDPDLDEGFAFVTLAAEPLEGLTTEAESLVDLYEGIAFDIVATRLQNDALRGLAPFDEASVGSTEITRGAVAPEVFITVDGDEVADGVQVVVDEY
ncbi:MAG: insulinase family protein, partial [Actinomycetota bacterium]